MRQDDFRDMVLVRRDFDFEYSGKRFLVNSKPLPDGNLFISFGEEYTKPQNFESYTQFMAEAKIDLRLLREIICDL